MKGLFFLTLGQADSYSNVFWTESSWIDLIESLGGIGFTTAAVLSFCFQERTKYCYDISRLKRFFYFAKDEDDPEQSSVDDNLQDVTQEEK